MTASPPRLPIGLALLVAMLTVLHAGEADGMAADGAADVKPMPAQLSRVPVLHEGRVKPFSVAAEEIAYSLTGMGRFGPVSADPGAPRRLDAKPWSSSALLVSLLIDAEAWRGRPLLYVPYQPLQRELGVDGQWVSLSEAEAHIPRILAVQERKRSEARGIAADLTATDEALLSLGRRILEARAVLSGEALLLAPLAASDADRAWIERERAALAAESAGASPRPWRESFADWAGGVAGGSSPAAPAAGGADRPTMVRDLALLAIWLDAADLALRPDSRLATWPDAVGPAAKRWGEALRSGDPTAIADASAALSPLLLDAGAARLAEVRRIDPDTTDRQPDARLIAVELAYVRARPFTWAWLAFIVGGILIGIGMKRSGRSAGPGSGRPAAWSGVEDPPMADAPSLATSERSERPDSRLQTPDPRPQTANWPSRIGVALTLFGILCVTAGLGARVWINGLAAVTNLYETLIFVGLLVAVLGLVFARLTGQGLYAVAGGIGAALCAMIGEAIPPDYGSHISQLQPVLRSRFWLWVHVKIIVASYAAFVLAWVLGNVVLTRALIRRRQVLAEEAQVIYRCLQVGVVLVAAGTLLGGVWAAQAWGRFWGWDPKEVYALLILLIYLIPLHLRYFAIVGPTGLAAWSVYGFLSVVMSWYGVNFILGAGLHAYAFGTGGVGIILPLCAIQVVATTVMLVLIRRMGRPGAAGEPAVR